MNIFTLYEQTSKDTSLLTLCKQLFFCVLKDGQSSVLLKILTSLLSMHVGALRKAVLFVLDGKECEDDALFSLNLLLQAGYDKSKQEELLGKLGASFKLIESVLGTLIKFRKIAWSTGTTCSLRNIAWSTGTTPRTNLSKQVWFPFHQHIFSLCCSI